MPNLPKTIGIIFSLLAGILVFSACASSNPSAKAPVAAPAIAQNQPATDNKAAQPDKTPAFKVYTHPGYGFSFEHPGDYNVTSFNDGNGETVLMQKFQNPNPKSQTNSNDQNSKSQNGMQIYISEFDEPGPITKERILQDLPDLKITDEKNIKVAGLDGLSFVSGDAPGQNYEIWFVNNGFLYQITAMAGNKSMADAMIKTIKFQ